MYCLLQKRLYLLTVLYHFKYDSFVGYWKGSKTQCILFLFCFDQSIFLRDFWVCFAGYALMYSKKSVYCLLSCPCTFVSSSFFGIWWLLHAASPSYRRLKYCYLSSLAVLPLGRHCLSPLRHKYEQPDCSCLSSCWPDFTLLEATDSLSRGMQRALEISFLTGFDKIVFVRS